MERDLTWEATMDKDMVEEEKEVQVLTMDFLELC